MDLRLQVSAIAALLSVALAANVLLREGKLRVHRAFAAFAVNVALFHLSAFLRHLSPRPAFERMHLAWGVLVALSAVRFFRAFVADGDRRLTFLSRTAGVVALGILVVLLTPAYASPFLPWAVVAYMLLSFYATLVLLDRRRQRTRSRFEAARLRYLTFIGGLAGTFTLLDYVPFYVDLDVPPIGTVFVLGFLYMLSQSITRARLIDLYELAGRLGVLAALSLVLAGTLFVLGKITGERFFVHSFVAALVVLLLFEPLRTRVEQWISAVFFWERFDLERLLSTLRRRIAHSLDVNEMASLVLGALEQSRRVTHASVYLAERDLRGYRLLGHLGPEPPRRIESAPARPMLDRLVRENALVLESIEAELEQKRKRSEDREAETTYEIVQTMEALHASVVLAITSSEGELVGILAVRDDRVRDAFAQDEVQLLVGLAAQMAIAVENSQLYQEMKERERLAALGEMAAGLAHEIRNPLGAIKASAQYLVEPGTESNPADREFLDIIVEETDRLNRVVGAFLDYARPSTGDARAIDVRDAVDRTLKLLGAELSATGTRLSVEEDPAMPKVRIDAERFRQVLLNLIRNAVEAMGNGGELRIRVTTNEVARGSAGTSWVELQVHDTGPGIPPEVAKHLFVPFVTTKDRGTGLGLAISQRIVAGAGGHIDVRTEPGKGTTFTVRLPAVEESTLSIHPPAPAA